MKKLLCLMLICALAGPALSGCSRTRSPEQETQQPAAADFAPESTALPEANHGEEDQSQALYGDPTLPPAETLAPGETPAGLDDDFFSIDALLEQADGPVNSFDDADIGDPDATAPAPANGQIIDPSTYQFSALIDTSLGFTFNYPSHWENLPGVSTVCYREVVEPGDYPARVAISVKKLAHSPEGNVIIDQMTSFFRTIYQMYNPNSFQAGSINEADSFLGQVAVSNTYLAYSGEIEVKGFVIGTAIGKTLIVFHFCASYDDYSAMEGVMRYMLRSVEPVGDK